MGQGSWTIFPTETVNWRVCCGRVSVATPPRVWSPACNRQTISLKRITWPWNTLQRQPSFQTDLSRMTTQMQRKSWNFENKWRYLRWSCSEQINTSSIFPYLTERKSRNSGKEYCRRHKQARLWCPRKKARVSQFCLKLGEQAIWIRLRTKNLKMSTNQQIDRNLKK